MFLLSVTQIWGQQWNDPLLHYPRFDECGEQNTTELPACFTQQMNFLIQEASKNWTLDGSTNERVSVLFEVDKSGVFVLRYMDSPSEQLRDNVSDFFSALPQIQPASYNGRTIYMQFRLYFSPSDLSDVRWSIDAAQSATDRLETKPNSEAQSKIQEPKIKSFTQSKPDEYGAVEQGKYQGQGYQSGVLILLSHRRYDEFEAAMNHSLVPPTVV